MIICTTRKYYRGSTTINLQILKGSRQKAINYLKDQQCSRTVYGALHPCALKLVAMQTGQDVCVRGALHIRQCLITSVWYEAWPVEQRQATYGRTSAFIGS